MKGRIRLLVAVCATLSGACVVACELAADLGPRKTLATPEGPQGGEAINDAGGPLADAGGDAPGIATADAPDDVETGPVYVQASVIAVGPTHACAVVSLGPGDQQVRCWGSNSSGELGAAQRPWSPPVRVHIPVGVQQLALAPGYSFAVTDDMPSYLYGWGAVPNDPVVTREPFSSPFEPSLMDYSGTPILGVVSVSIGPNGGCFNQVNQPAQCWGPYTYGSAGDAGMGADAGSIIYDPFDSVAVGRAHACGVALHNGVDDVECWGANDHGQAGGPVGMTRVTDPTPLGLATGSRQVAKVAVGKDTSCALLDDGSVYCWGANDRGQVGTLDAGRDLYTPTHVVLPLTPTGKEMVMDLAVGDSHACALLSIFNVWCWGDATVAQLGNNSLPTPQRPGAVHMSQAMKLSAQGIAAGGRTTCAIDQKHQVRCWGANEFGQAGPIAPDAGASYLPFATLVAF